MAEIVKEQMRDIASGEVREFPLFAAPGFLLARAATKTRSSLDGLKALLEKRPELAIDHQDAYTVVEARRGDLFAIGVAKRNPRDKDRPVLGNTLATYRALRKLLLTLQSPFGKDYIPF